MKLQQLQEASYYKHPAVNWLEKKMSIGRAVSDRLILTKEQFAEVWKILQKELGEPKEKYTGGMWWVLKNEYGEFDVDLQFLIGPPKDRARRLSISSYEENVYEGLQEARYIGEDKPLYYFEYYPHGAGTLVSKFKTTLNVVDDLALRYQREGGDAIYDSVMILGRAYAFFDVLHEWPKIRKELETKGSWADGWEEGSHGLSTTHALDAKDAVIKLEKSHGGWYSGDEERWMNY